MNVFNAHIMFSIIAISFYSFCSAMTHQHTKTPSYNAKRLIDNDTHKYLSYLEQQGLPNIKTMKSLNERIIAIRAAQSEIPADSPLHYFLDSALNEKTVGDLGSDSFGEELKSIYSMTENIVAINKIQQQLSTPATDQNELSEITTLLKKNGISISTQTEKKIAFGQEMKSIKNKQPQHGDRTGYLVDKSSYILGLYKNALKIKNAHRENIENICNDTMLWNNKLENIKNEIAASVSVSRVESYLEKFNHLQALAKKNSTIEHFSTIASDKTSKTVHTIKQTTITTLLANMLPKTFNSNLNDIWKETNKTTSLSTEQSAISNCWNAINLAKKTCQYIDEANTEEKINQIVQDYQKTLAESILDLNDILERTSTHLILGTIKIEPSNPQERALLPATIHKNRLKTVHKNLSEILKTIEKAPLQAQIADNPTKVALRETIATLTHVSLISFNPAA